MRKWALLLTLTMMALGACRPVSPAETPVTEPEVAEVKPVGATTFVHDAGGIQFTAPQGWKSPNADNDGDEVVTLVSPDEQLEVSFYVTGDESFAEAQKDIVDELGKYIKNAKIREKEARESTLNGLKTVSIPGSGTDAEDGKPVEWDLTIIEAKKPVFVISVAAPETFAKHAAAYETLVQSIKPLAAMPVATVTPVAKSTPQKR